MQFRLLTAMVVFLGSYLPLAVILFSQNIEYSAFKKELCTPLKDTYCSFPVNDAKYSIGFLLITLTCFGLTILFLALVKPAQDVNISSVEYVPTDLMNYTLPYIVSLMGVNYSETNKFVGFCVFLAWMFWITHKSGQIFLNPILIALGWRLYKITYNFSGSKDPYNGRALVKGYLEPGYFKQSLVQDIQIIKPKDAQ